MASLVRLLFIRPADTVPLSSYYAVYDVEIEGRCSCFGHSNECVGEVSLFLLDSYSIFYCTF